MNADNYSTMKEEFTILNWLKELYSGPIFKTRSEDKWNWVRLIRFAVEEKEEGGGGSCAKCNICRI